MPERLGALVATRWFDPALAALLIALGSAEMLTREHLGDSALAPIVVVLVCGLVAARRRHPVAAACAQTVVMVVPLGVGDNLPQTLVVAVAVVSFSCGAHASGRSGLLAVVAQLVGLQVLTGFADFPNFELLVLTLPWWWVGRQIRLRGELVRALADRNRELEAEEDAFARLSVRRERARIAHELHDIVSHHLAVIVVQAGAGMVASRASEDGAAEHLESIRDSGAQALAEMARLVDLLQADEGSPGVGERLQLLLDQAHTSGVEIHAESLSPDLHLSEELEETAYRIVREGLTNAMKHAPGADVHVLVAARGETLELEVRNARRPSSTLAETGSGLGLAGMRERVDAVGGTLQAGPDTDGWRLSAQLPLPPPRHVPAP